MFPFPIQSNLFCLITCIFCFNDFFFFCYDRQSLEIRRHMLNYAWMLRELFNSGINSTSSWGRAGKHPVYWWPARARLTPVPFAKGVFSVLDYFKIYSLPNLKYIGIQVPFLSLTSSSQKMFGTNRSDTLQGCNGRLWLKEAEDP